MRLSWSAIAYLGAVPAKACQRLAQGPKVPELEVPVETGGRRRGLVGVPRDRIDRPVVRMQCLGSLVLRQPDIREDNPRVVTGADKFVPVSPADTLDYASVMSIEGGDLGQAWVSELRECSTPVLGPRCDHPVVVVQRENPARMEVDARVRQLDALGSLFIQSDLPNLDAAVVGGRQELSLADVTHLYISLTCDAPRWPVPLARARQARAPSPCRAPFRHWLWPA